MKKIAVSLIKFYQNLSRVILGNTQLPFLSYSGCRFYPTCSEYAIGAINKHGVVKGSIKSGIRILRCNPLVKGGINNP